MSRLGRYGGRQVCVEHPHAFLGHARGDLFMQLHRPRINAVSQLHCQGKHIDIRRQRRQFEMADEQFVHQVAQLDIVLAVGLGDFGQTVLGEDQLARGGVFAVDHQHPLLQ